MYVYCLYFLKLRIFSYISKSQNIRLFNELFLSFVLLHNQVDPPVTSYHLAGVTPFSLLMQPQVMHLDGYSIIAFYI